MNVIRSGNRAEIEAQWEALFFGVKRTVRYHLYRRKFFETLKLSADFLVIISGGTVVSLASSGEPKRNIGVIIAGAVTAIVGTFDLVLGFSNKARDYRDLVKAFSDLEAEMTEDALTKDHLTDFTNKRLKLEVDEPPIKHVLNMYCHNEMVRAMGYPEEDLADIKWWQSIPKQLFDIYPHRIKTFRQIEAARLAKEKAKADAAATASPEAPEVRA